MGPWAGAQGEEARVSRTSDEIGTADGRLKRLILAARAAIVWDRLWPALIPPLVVVALFLTVSGLGLWLVVPGWARIAGTVLFGLVFVASLLPLARLRLPSRDEALARVDRDGALQHRPATAAEDRLALGGEDPASRALWALHRQRAARAVLALPVPKPRPDAPRRDPFAFRAAALVALVASLFVAGPEWRARVAAAFDWRGSLGEAAPFRLDAWVDPPVYTRQPPVVLDLTTPPEGGTRRHAVRVPANSTIIVRAAGRSDVALALSGGIADAPKETQEGKDGAVQAARDLPAPPAARPGEPAMERRLRVSGTGEIAVDVGRSRQAVVALEAIPDRAPSAEWSRPPEQTARGGLTLFYRAQDDYAVARIEALMEPVDPAAAGRALVPPPRPPLALPADPTANAETSAGLDLADHPWAGARVRTTIVVGDDAGQEGRSEPLVVTLPQRPFAHPLAKALIEQRRNLVMDREARPIVQTALDALAIAPDLFSPKLGEYLGLAVGSQRLRNARTDEDLLDVAQYLWEMAVRLEDGDLSGAERDLRAAQEALRQAIERGANEDEIRRLMNQLRQAMNNFLRELAERAQRNQQNAENQPNQRNQPSRTITQQDLNRMLDRMEQMMREGNVADAQRLLEQLKQMMENLQTARPGRSPQQQEMEQSLNELDEMTRDQQDLRDETFQNQPPDAREQRRRQGQNQNQFGQNRQRQQPGQRQRGQQGQQGQQQPGQGQQAEGDQQGQGQQDMQALRDRQQRLRERLEAMRRRMQERGQQSGEGELGEAEDAMRQAEQGLGQGNGDQALDGQGRALDALRRGGEQMARDMQPGQDGDGEGQANGEPGQGSDRPGSRQADRGQDPNDPLGRPVRNPRDNDNARFDRRGGRAGSEIRIDEVISELRRRLGDPTRSQEELDYFERLLRQR